MMLYEKYRPRQWSELAGQSKAVAKVRHIIEADSFDRGAFWIGCSGKWNSGWYASGLTRRVLPAMLLVWQDKQPQQLFEFGKRSAVLVPMNAGCGKEPRTNTDTALSASAVAERVIRELTGRRGNRCMAQYQTGFFAFINAMYRRVATPVTCFWVRRPTIWRMPERRGGSFRHPSATAPTITSQSSMPNRSERFEPEQQMVNVKPLWPESLESTNLQSGASFTTATGRIFPIDFVALMKRKNNNLRDCIQSMQAGEV